ncbi:18663_t:CDS:2, partial [Gigaspora margarita]
YENNEQEQTEFIECVTKAVDEMENIIVRYVRKTLYNLNRHIHSQHKDALNRFNNEEDVQNENKEMIYHESNDVETSTSGSATTPVTVITSLEEDLNIFLKQLIINQKGKIEKIEQECDTKYFFKYD